MPTMDEQGFKGFDASSWYGVVGPRDMSRELAQRINADINRVLAMPDVVSRFDGYGVADGGGSVVQVAAFMRLEEPTFQLPATCKLVCRLFPANITVMRAGSVSTA